MKLSGIKFLATANSKGNKKSNLIIALMFLMVISIALISSFSITVEKSINERKEDFRSRALELLPWSGELTDDILKTIRGIDHVQEVFMLKGMRDVSFSILEITDENGKCDNLQKQIAEEDSGAWTFSLIGNEKKSVIAGKSLDESPTFSCIIPNKFNLFSGASEEDDAAEYIDGETLIGKTLTVTANGGDYFEVLYNFFDGTQGGNEWVQLPALQYKLKVAGVYYESPTNFGYSGMMFISEETGMRILEDELKAGGYNLNSDKSDVEKWWSKHSLRSHYVLVDEYDNIPYVYNEISKMGCTCANDPEFGMRESDLVMLNILSVVSVVLLIAPALLFIIILIQSTTSALNKRKGEIGLLKSVGYKNSQIFYCLCYEQLILTVKGFIMGGLFSAAFIFAANYFNSTGNVFVNRLYIVNWSDIIILLAISLIVAIIVPLVCQLLLLKKLAKIQPRDAMN